MIAPALVVAPDALERCGPTGGASGSLLAPGGRVREEVRLGGEIASTLPALGTGKRSRRLWLGCRPPLRGRPTAHHEPQRWHVAERDGWGQLPRQSPSGDGLRRRGIDGGGLK